MEIKPSSTPPPNAYEIGSEPKGGRRARYPFKNMSVNSSTTIALDADRISKHRGQIMAAIRSTCYRFPLRVFKVADVLPSEDEPEVKTLSLRVWRVEDKETPKK
jgi:hypothetical protein